MLRTERLNCPSTRRMKRSMGYRRSQLRRHLIPITSLLAISLILSCKEDLASETAVAESVLEQPVEPVKDEPLPKAINGAPLSAEFIEFTGDGLTRRVKTTLYNHGPKTAGGYVLLVRYFDSNGELLRVRPGSAFESFSAFMSYSGAAFTIPAEKRTTIEIENVHVPDKAHRAEVIATKVDAIESGNNVYWFTQPRWSAWPNEDDAVDSEE